MNLTQNNTAGATLKHTQGLSMQNYYISTKKSLLLSNKEKICSLLGRCFWSKNIPVEYVANFIERSLCFGAYISEQNLLIGFGRVISDYTTYAYMCDIIIEDAYRKQGIGSALVNSIFAHPELQGLKTWELRTSEEARKIYEKRGFKIIENHETQMELEDLDIYTKPTFVNLHKN